VSGPILMDDPSSLIEAVTLVRRRFGAAALRRGGDPLPEPAWVTGVPALDQGLGQGGLVRGRLTVLAGARSPVTGRLTLLQALAAVASRTMPVVYVDLVGTLDPGFLADLGADLDACLVVRPPGGDLAPGLVMGYSLVAAGVPWLAVALPVHPQPAWRRAEPALAALVATVEGRRAVACVAAPAPLAAPLAYASSLTVTCRSLGWQEEHDDVVGLRVGLEVVKSRVGTPGSQAGVLLRYPRPHGTGEVVGFPTVVGLPASPDGAGVAATLGPEVTPAVAPGGGPAVAAG